jgi:hypothetical protein
MNALFRVVIRCMLLSYAVALSMKSVQLESKLLSQLEAPSLDLSSFKTTVAELEAAKGIPNPTSSRVLDGVWRLLYSGNDVVANASPIQRTVTSLKQVKIFQVVHLNDKTESFLTDKENVALPDVSNTVCFGDFRLRVTALGSTVS